MELFNRIAEGFTESRNSAYAVAGSMGGGLVSIHLLDIPASGGVADGVELALKWGMTLTMAGITGLVTKMGADTWTEHIKPKIKIFKNGKKSDEQKRA